jgi:asparagine synthase (glutamine-hydrolysing)
VDIASMACSLEVRTPFLDHNVVEFAAALPLEYKQRRTSRKHILKMAFADMLPPELMNRRKRGFGVPLAQWFRGEWRHLLNERLLEGELCQRGYFKKSALQLMIKTHLESNSDLSYPLWSLLIFELFLEQDAT